MTAVTRSPQILVHAPLQTVFDYVSDLSRHPEWSGGLKIEAVSSGPIGVGKEYISHGEVAIQKDRPNKVQVSAYEPPHKFGFIAHDPDFGNVSHVFTFTKQNGGVLIRRAMTVNLNPLVALAFRFFIYPLIGRPSMNKSLAALKTKLEDNRMSLK
ncbi:MAG TPA: SRPBCC family protein [Anaerolineales bacterium]|nr:SRPBCC family protein [Anaerolineales bacterium]